MIHPICDACGSPKIGTHYGGAYICRDCDPPIREEMERLREDGKPVNVLHIAKRRFRETNDGGAYLLRDIPADLLARVQHRAVDEKASIRDIILQALIKYLT